MISSVSPLVIHPLCRSPLPCVTAITPFVVLVLLLVQNCHPNAQHSGPELTDPEMQSHLLSRAQWQQVLPQLPTMNCKICKIAGNVWKIYKGSWRQFSLVIWLAVSTTECTQGAKDQLSMNASSDTQSRVSGEAKVHQSDVILASNHSMQPVLTI